MRWFCSSSVRFCDLKRICPSCGEKAVPLGAVYWAFGRLKPPAICGECGRTCRPRLWLGLLSGVVADPLFLLFLGLVVDHYVGGYIAVTAVLLLLANVFAYPIYAPLVAVAETERRQEIRRWGLWLLRAVFLGGLLWILLGAAYS